MSTENMNHSPESDADFNFEETKLTLGLPGESRGLKSGTKRGFLETVDLNLGSSNDNRGSKNCDKPENDVSSTAKLPATK